MNEAALRRPVDDAPPSPPPAPAVSYNTPGIMLLVYLWWPGADPGVFAGFGQTPPNPTHSENNVVKW